MERLNSVTFVYWNVKDATKERELSNVRRMDKMLKEFFCIISSPSIRRDTKAIAGRVVIRGSEKIVSRQYSLDVSIASLFFDLISPH